MHPLQREITSGPSLEELKRSFFERNGQASCHSTPVVFHVQNRQEKIFVCIHTLTKEKDQTGIIYRIDGHTTEPIHDISGVFNPESQTGWLASSFFN